MNRKTKFRLAVAVVALIVATVGGWVARRKIEQYVANRLILGFAETNDTESLRWALRCGINPNVAKDEFDGNALHIASWHGYTEVAALLLDAGARPSIKDPYGQTPLHLCGRLNHEKITELLISKGADVHAVDGNGWTPLFDAVRRTDSSGVIRLLLKAGADVNAADQGGDTPLILAATWGRDSVLRMLIEAGADVNARNLNGVTALHRTSSAECALVLIRAGADPKATTKNGTPMLMTVGGYPERMKVLIDAGCDINRQDRRGWTPLHYASHNGRKECVKLLLSAGADPSIKDKQERTARSMAHWEEMEKIFDRHAEQAKESK